MNPVTNQASQKQYDSVVMAALGILYGEMSRDMVLQKLEGGADNLPQVIGHTAAMVLKSVVEGIKQKGREVPREVIAGAGQEVVAEVMEIAIAAKLLPKEEAETVGKAAMAEARKVFEGQGAKAPQGAAPQGMPPQPPQQAGIIAGRMGA